MTQADSACSDEYVNSTSSLTFPAVTPQMSRPVLKIKFVVSQGDVCVCVQGSRSSCSSGS